MANWGPNFCDDVRKRLRDDPDEPHAIDEWLAHRAKSRADRDAADPVGSTATNLENVKIPAVEDEDPSVFHSDEQAKWSSLFGPSKDKLGSSLNELMLSPEQLREYSNQSFAAREKDLQTKEGRAKWEAYEKKWNCVGYYEATKKQMIHDVLTEKLDMDEMMKLVQEQKAKDEAAGKKPATSNAKGKKGKK